MIIWVTGACGFIGTNICKRYLDEMHLVVGIDNLSRKGSGDNLEVLSKYPNFKFKSLNVESLLSNKHFKWSALSEEPDVIFHMAAQVGVTKSIEDPMYDFGSNILGTLAILEYARTCTKKPIVLFASTNKVYGDIQVNTPISEETPLNFHTPYGCSKGAADQYVLDYNRIYDVPTVVFRQSCIYGPYQHGAEEQGWIDHFIKSVVFGNGKLNFYGDGTQVRDVLYVDDLVELYDLAVENIEQVRGQAFNVGGGEENVLSLNECIEIIEKESDKKASITYHDWRPADQKYYVSDITKVKKALNWSPKVNPKTGIRKSIEASEVVYA
jgi:CDP-paratose 2-epimerase